MHGPLGGAGKRRKPRNKTGRKVEVAVGARVSVDVAALVDRGIDPVPDHHDSPMNCNPTVHPLPWRKLAQTLNWSWINGVSEFGISCCSRQRGNSLRRLIGRGLTVSASLGDIRRSFTLSLELITAVKEAASSWEQQSLGSEYCRRNTSKLGAATRHFTCLAARL